MKKIATLMTTMLTSGILLTGCFKTGSYTCVCIDTNGDEERYPIENSTKTNARVICTAMEVNGNDCTLE